MDIHVEMHLSYETDVWAYGMVTLENTSDFRFSFVNLKIKIREKRLRFLVIPEENVVENGKIYLYPKKIKGRN